MYVFIMSTLATKVITKNKSYTYCVLYAVYIEGSMLNGSKSVFAHIRENRIKTLNIKSA